MNAAQRHALRTLADKGELIIGLWNTPDKIHVLTFFSLERMGFAERSTPLVTYDETVCRVTDLGREKAGRK